MSIKAKTRKTPEIAVAETECFSMKKLNLKFALLNVCQMLRAQICSQKFLESNGYLMPTKSIGENHDFHMGRLLQSLKTLTIAHQTAENRQFQFKLKHDILGLIEFKGLKSSLGFRFEPDNLSPKLTPAKDTCRWNWKATVGSRLSFLTHF